MATKLPSGMWRQQVFIGYDEKGKRKYKSFTAETKEGVKLKALQYSATLPHDKSNVLTVRKAIQNYIDIKTPVASPTTMRGYKAIQRSIETHDPAFAARRLYTVDEDALQRFVNVLYDSELSAKTVRNMYHLVGAVMRQNGFPVPSVTLPTRARPELNVPDSETVQRLFGAIKGTRWEVPVLLAALAPMRRGEIVAASIHDLSDDNILYVHRAAVSSPSGDVIKDYPKTDKSNRYIMLPDYVADLIRQQGYVTRMSCKTISTHFHDLLDDNNIKRFRFHDLRHAFVSIAHAAGIPDAYIMARGGWSTPYTMQNVYRHVLDKERREQEQKVNDTFKCLY